MDEDRYYNLGSHDKLFNQIDELTDALASRDAEIESLRQQLILKEHQYDVMKASAEVLAEQCDKMCQQLETSQKREVMLRDALEYHQAQTRPIQRTEEALAATDDLDGLILCDREPAAIVYRDYGGNGAILQTELADDEPLYRTKGPK